MAIQIQLKRGVLANRPVLLSGEMYYVTDTQQLFVGPTPVKFASVVATLDQTAVQAAITATTLFTPTITGMFLIEVRLKVTRAAVGATASSTLAGSTGAVLTYADGDDSVALSQTMLLSTQAGVGAINNAANTTQTSLNGTAVIYAKAGTAITIAIGYTNGGSTVMQYSAHVKVTAK